MHENFRNSLVSDDFSRTGPPEPVIPLSESRYVQNVDELLDGARANLQRLSPRLAYEAMLSGAVLIDTRPEFQRRAGGEIPGATMIERNHLEWRCDPASPDRIREAANHDVQFVIICNEGYSSSLAAASLQSLGLHRATDVIGGFQSWRADDLPVRRPDQPES